MEEINSFDKVLKDCLLWKEIHLWDLSDSDLGFVSILEIALAIVLEMIQSYSCTML